MNAYGRWGLTCSCQQSLASLSTELSGTTERFGDDTDDAAGDAGDEAGRVCPALDQSLDGMMGETADGAKDADPDSAEAVDEALAEALGSLSPEDLVSPAVLVVEGQTVQVPGDAAGKVGHRSQGS